MKLKPDEYPPWLVHWLIEQDIVPTEIHIEETEETEIVTVIMENEFFKLYYNCKECRVDRE